MRGEWDYRGREEKNKKIKEKNKRRKIEIYIHSYKKPFGRIKNFEKFPKPMEIL